MDSLDVESREQLLKYNTKRLENPFGCVLTQRSSLALKPKSLFQRLKNKQQELQIRSSAEYNPNQKSNNSSAIKLKSSYYKDFPSA